MYVCIHIYIYTCVYIYVCNNLKPDRFGKGDCFIPGQALQAPAPCTVTDFLLLLAFSGLLDETLCAAESTSLPRQLFWKILYNYKSENNQYPKP